MPKKKRAKKTDFPNVNLCQILNSTASISLNDPMHAEVAANLIEMLATNEFVDTRALSDNLHKSITWAALSGPICQPKMQTNLSPKFVKKNNRQSSQLSIQYGKCMSRPFSSSAKCNSTFSQHQIRRNTYAYQTVIFIYVDKL